jgi:ABC-type Fe3+ transport system permease subunit
MKSIREKGILSIKGLAVVIILILTAAPVLYLIFGSVASLFSGILPSDSGISGELFVRSMVLFMVSAGFSVLLGLLSAIGIWVFFEKHSPKIAILIILMILIPPFIHVQSWIS